MAKDEVKNINVGQCFGTIFACLFACLIIFVPFTFGNTGFVLFKDVMPFIGDGSYEFVHPFNSKEFLDTITFINPSILIEISKYAPMVFFGIIAIDVAFALILLIFQFTFFRVIFKIISIIFGIVMLGVALYYLLYVIGFVLHILNFSGNVNVMMVLETSGILVALVMMIFAFSFIGKQFKWFAKLY